MAEKPWIGFAVRKAPGKNNLLVHDVSEDGPAYKAGLRQGDELGSIDGKKVPDTTAFKAMFKNWQVGQSLAVEIMRDDNGVDNAIKKTITLVIGKKGKEEVPNPPPMTCLADVEAILKDQEKLRKANIIIFQAVDSDLSGLVTRQEFIDVMGPWLEKNLNMTGVHSKAEWTTHMGRIFDDFDNDKSGYMKKSEFEPVTKASLEEFVKAGKAKQGGAPAASGGAAAPAAGAHGAGAGAGAHAGAGAGAGAHAGAGAGAGAGAAHNDPPAKPSWKQKYCKCCPCFKKKN